MTYTLIALVGASFILNFWFFRRLSKSEKENNQYRKSIQYALEALGRDLTNFQAGVSRDLDRTNKNVEGNLNSIKRIDRKVDVREKFIINSLPSTIRNVIGHIEFAKPLDSNHGRG